jgi:hypothetical protein
MTARSSNVRGAAATAYCFGGFATSPAVSPPSTTNSAPVENDDSSLARKTTSCEASIARCRSRS